MRVRAFVAALAAAALAAALVPALGSAATPRIEAVGTDKVKINKYLKNTLRFKKPVTVAKSGRTVKLVNRTREPHSFSIVKKSQLPSNAKEVFECFEGPPCAPFFGAHEFPEDEGPPGKPLVDADGDGGFNVPGDSVLFNAKGEEGDTVNIKLTARKGKTLSYLCIFHPWMQGKLKAN